MTIQSLKFFRKFCTLICNFAFCILIFAFLDNAYAFSLDKAKVYFLNGDYNACINECEKILASPGYSREVDGLYYLLGLSYLKEENYLRSSDIFEIILKEFKDSAFRDDALLGLGDTYFLRGDYDKAESKYKDLIDGNRYTKLRATVYYRLSQIGFKKGNTQEAKEYLDKLKREFPLNPETRLNRDLGSISDLYYTVQVGSFANSINAQNLKQKLIQQGYPAYIEEGGSRDKIIYRVKVGKLRLRKEAESLENKLIQEGYPTRIRP